MKKHKESKCTYQLTNWVPKEKLECFKEDLKKGNRSYIIKEIDSNKVQSGYSKDRNFYGKKKNKMFYAIFTTGKYMDKLYVRSEPSQRMDTHKSKKYKKSLKVNALYNDRSLHQQSTN